MERIELLKQGFYDILLQPDGTYEATKDEIRFRKIKSSKVDNKYIISQMEL